MEDPLFLGGHPAIDFLNTIYSPHGISVEVIGDGDALLRWLVAAKLLDTSIAASIRRRFGGAALDAVAAEARQLRSWVVGWIDRWSRWPRDPYATELRRLNALLEHGHRYREVVQTEGGVLIVEREHMLDVGELLPIIAAQIALLIAHEDSRLVKHCAGAACTLRFLDRTKSHRRVFCSAAACGNRAKVAAFRNRQRG